MPSADVAGPGTPAGRRPRVLLADDHRGMLEAMARLLGASCEIVGRAQTGHEALSLALGTEPDVVVLDLAMPDMSGIAACRQIRERLPRARVVLLTAYSDAQVARAGFEAGAAAFVNKYTATEDLERAVLDSVDGDPGGVPR
jgi:DNA-binding NarL/FixJ family response regulator